mgnify:FL=1
MEIKNIKYIYVLDRNGKPLMPTKRLGMVRRWLSSGQAHWYRNSRNTIQFNRPTTHHLQNITQGCDLGDHLGISVITNKQEIYSSESHCNGNNTHKRMQERKMYRRARRNRLRYRKPRFDNRKHAKYAPSIKRKLAFQIKEIARISKFLPVNNYIFEGSVFDINKLTHHMQQQKGYHNILEFLYARDNCCDALDGKQYPKSDLIVHHLIHRANGGTNNPDNLVLLTREHHNQANHNNGVLDKLTKERQQTFKNVDTRGAYFMNILNVELPKNFDYLPTFGYITAQKRKQYGIIKTHHDDAFVIAGGTNHTLRLGYTIYREKLRCNNRCLEKFYDATYRDLRDNKIKKGAVLSSGRNSRSRELSYNNQRVYRANKIKKGRRTIRKQHYQLRPYDLVIADRKSYCVKGIHNKGTRVILIASPKDISKAISKVNVKYHVNGVLVTIK